MSLPKLENSVIIGHKKIHLKTQKQRPDEKKVWPEEIIVICAVRTKKWCGVYLIPLFVQSGPKINSA